MFIAKCCGNVYPHVEEIHPSRKIRVTALLFHRPARIFGMLFTTIYREG